jgi:hypothetical protein
VKAKFFILLALILSVFLISSLSHAGVKEYLEKRLSDGLAKGSENYKGWEEGLLSERSLILKDITVSVEILGQKERDTDLMVVAKIIIIAFTVDKQGVKKRFIRQMLVGYLYDKETQEPKYQQIIESMDSLIGGWDGKDC